MSEAQRSFLRRLRDAGPEGLPSSSVPTRCEPLVARLTTCGAVERRLGKSRGFSLHLRDMTSFANYVESQYPAGLDVDKDDLVDHASAVALLGDAKAVRQSSHHGVFLRSIKRHITIRRPDTDALLPVGELTAIAGGASIVLADGIVWEFAGTVATIENAETFWRYEQVLPNVDLAIFTQGRMSERKLAWLASSLMAEARYIHWGDYDPVGITEYLRLLAACPDRVQMYCPPNLEELLSKFGKPALITEQTKTLDSLRDSHDNTVQKLVTLFDRYGRGLEQELLLML